MISGSELGKRKKETEWTVSKFWSPYKESGRQQGVGGRINGSYLNAEGNREVQTSHTHKTRERVKRTQSRSVYAWSIG